MKLCNVEFIRTCKWCGRRFRTYKPTQVFCSSLCTLEVNALKRKSMFPEKEDIKEKMVGLLRFYIRKGAVFPQGDGYLAFRRLFGK